MNPKTRPIAAAIGAAIINKNKITSVYDYGTGSYINIEAEMQGNKVKAYDYTQSCFIEGNLPSSVYHYGDGSFMTFKLNGQKIDGYDYGSGSFFEVKVQGRNIVVYDYADGGFHNFSV